jgi:lysine-N-methylase
MVMRIRYPKYYKKFHCLASACPDSCCKEWEVLVDEMTAADYSTMEGPLGEDLRRYLYQDAAGEWYLRITEGRCPMWRDDGLCRIQAEKGHEALCETCREFPRLRHDYGDFVELGLEMSCPEAARMIFAESAEWAEEEMPCGEVPEYSPEDMEVLLQTRQKMLQILGDGRYSVQQALALGLLYGYRAQDVLDGWESEAFDPEAELAFAETVAKPGGVDELKAFYLDLEILTEQWRQRLQAPAGETRWDPRLRTLARYGVERYWLQAISDFDLVGRVKMVIASCLLVRALGGDLVETAQLYAKEIENNIDNVEAILDGAYSHPALTDERLLGMLR